jgi:alpha-galactosidase
MLGKKFQEIDPLSMESGELEARSKEYCSYILEALETYKVFKLSGNVMNKGYINNLPQNACIEVPVFADKMGLHPTVIGDLPPHLAAMNQSNITVQSLTVEAALKFEPEMAFWAVAMDPLTAGVLSLKEIRKMVIEMFEAEAKWLPQFRDKKLRQVDLINIPKGTVGVPVPTDPALAINNRFGKLAQ